MKNKFNIAFAFLSFFLLGQGFAQQNKANNDNKKIILERFTDLMKQYQPGDWKEFADSVKLMDDIRLRKIAKIIYQATEYAPIEVNWLLKENSNKMSAITKERYKKYGEQGYEKLKKSFPKEIPFYGVLEGFYDELGRRYSLLIKELIKSNIIIRGKVKYIREANENIVDDDGSFMTAEKRTIGIDIETKLKGDGENLNKNFIEGYDFKFWYHTCPVPEYLEGKSYLFLLRNKEPKNLQTPFAIETLLNDGTEMLIEDDKLKDPTEVFGLGWKANWDIVQNILKDKITRIENELEY